MVYVAGDLNISDVEPHTTYCYSYWFGNIGIDLVVNKSDGLTRIYDSGAFPFKGYSHKW